MSHNSNTTQTLSKTQTLETITQHRPYEYLPTLKSQSYKSNNKTELNQGRQAGQGEEGLQAGSFRSEVGGMAQRLQEKGGRRGFMNGTKFGVCTMVYV
jgi:hypothetical protein